MMRVEQAFPIPPRDLFEVLTSEDYLRARAERFGGVGEPRVSTAGSTVTVKTARQLPMDAVPSMFRSFVGEGKVVQTDEWTATGDGATGTWHAETGPAPMDLTGTHAITASGTGATYTVTGEAKVNVPLMGGKIAKQVEDYLETLMSKEQEFAAGYVAQRR